MNTTSITSDTISDSVSNFHQQLCFRLWHSNEQMLLNSLSLDDTGNPTWDF